MKETISNNSAWNKVSNENQKDPVIEKYDLSQAGHPGNYCKTHLAILEHYWFGMHEI